jgi:hypothetical protein
MKTNDVCPHSLGVNRKNSFTIGDGIVNDNHHEEDMKVNDASSNSIGVNRKNSFTIGDKIGNGIHHEDDEIDSLSNRETRRNKAQLQHILDNLMDVEKALNLVLQTHRDGDYGFITREWGFTAPGGLGGQLKGKFYPWEMKLRFCKNFFWPIECYEAMEKGPDFGRPDHDMVKDLPPEAEQLYGNTPLHNFLKEAPSPGVQLYKEDYREYRSAARIFLLLGTLSHLYGNSAPNGPKTAPLPSWIEDPLLEVARRLKIEPTLSGHFLVQENWIWKTDADDESSRDFSPDGKRRRFQKRSSITLSKRRLSKTTSKRVERMIVGCLLRECKCEDRMYRIKVYPDCFLGSQCVDVMMEHRFSDNREEAVRLVRRINRVYKLFTHVTNDNYELMDTKFFYRFRKNWKTRRYMAMSGQLLDSSIKMSEEGFGSDELTHGNNRSVTFQPPQQDTNSAATSIDNSFVQPPEQSEHSITAKSVARLSSTYNGSRIVPSTHVSMHDTMSIIHVMAKVRIKDRRKLWRIYKKCFVGKELIDVLMEHQCGTTRKECLELALSINQRFRLFEHVKRQSLLGDRNLFYRFTEGFRSMTENQTYASTMVEAGRGGPVVSQRRVSFSDLPVLPSFDEMNSTEEFSEEDFRPSYSDYGESYDAILGLEEEMEFSLDNITMLYPAFGNNHERINQLVPACMGFSLSSLPYDVLDILSAMRDVLEAELNAEEDGDNYEINRLYDLVYKVAFSVSKCKEEFQQMSTDPKKRTFNSKYVSIKQTQPLSNGVLVRKSKDADPTPAKGTTGTQFPYFHILDWLLGRFQYESNDKDMDRGLVAAVGSIDDTFPRPQREYIRCLSKLNESSSLRGFLEIIGRPKELLTAYNHLIECYAGESGVLQAHCRKLYSYIHNNVQSSTSGTNHLATAEKEDSSDSDSKSKQSDKSGCPMHESSNSNSSKQSNSSECPMNGSSNSDSKGKQSSSSGCPMFETSNPDSKSKQSSSSGCPMHETSNADSKSKQSNSSGCPMHGSSNSDSKSKQSSNSGCPMSLSSNQSANSIDNHKFAITMFKHMRMAADDRWKLRLPPLMSEVGKVIYSTSESGGFTTVALDLSGTGLLYEYGDVVKVILPNDDKQTLSWLHSLQSMNKEFFKMEDMTKLQQNTGNGWGWDRLWEALGWYKFEENGGSGVPLETIARYIEQGHIRDETSNKSRWVHSPLDLSNKGSSQVFASPPPIPTERIISLEPVSPRIYSVSGVEIDRVFLLVSKPDDHARHHGYSSMSDPKITKVHCSFSPATFFLLPPKDVNLVCIASGTGISPFVGLVDAIGYRTGSYTIVHQCKSSDMFMCNSQTWLDFTAMNPGAIVMGYISGDRSRRNCPMRYIIRNGAFEETTVLRRRRICAYYFECETFQKRILETYKGGELNLAYCCGGVKSAIMPLQTLAESNGMEFEYTCESYGVPVTLTKASNLLSQIGGTIIDLNHVSPIHPGGDQILHQANDIAINMARMDNKKESDTPDHSIAFYELHPHAYNLHRCLRTPVDADSKAFATFLERQAMSKSVLGNMATKYARAVLSAPESSKIVKIATELQSSAISAQLGSGDTEGAKRSASYLKELLNHVPDDDDDSKRWERSLDLLPPSARKSSVVFNVPDDDNEAQKWDDVLPPSRRKSSIVFNVQKDDNETEKWDDVLPPSRRKSSIVFNVPKDDDDTDRWRQSLDLLPPSRRKSSVVLKIPEGGRL